MSLGAQLHALLPAPVFTPLLRSGYQLVAGAPLETFEFLQSPFSAWHTVESMAVLYLALVALLRLLHNTLEIKHTLRPYFKPFFIVHNAFLSVFSLVLFVVLLENIAPVLLKEGIFFALCSPTMYTKELQVIYYLNYLTKYFEFIDTLFLVANGSKLEFLHWYHHSMTMLLCYVQIIGKPSVQWVPILLNLLVHFVMYYYYALAALNIRVWWKQWITTLQIIQFVVDLAAVYYATYYAAFDLWRPLVPASLAASLSIPETNEHQCTGTPFAAGFGCALLTSYLALFIRFFIQTYLSKPAAGKGKGAVKPKTE
ncbi:ELO family [Blastocladiella britannica]|nr:ELO family [Blastocladiella britannica]